MSDDYFECSCHSPEHTLKFTFDDDPEYPAIYVCVFLAEGKLLTRIWNAIKYVLGYKCRYGHFDEFILQREDCDRLVSVVNKFKNSGT
jgi:hypothetical protein